jgi:hypothetical protein
MTNLAKQASKAAAVALTSLVTLVALGGAAFAGPAPLDEGGRAGAGGGATPPPADTGTDWAMWGMYAGVALIVVGLVALTSILTVRNRQAGAHA